MDVFEIFAIIAAIVGLLGSIVPGIPGPPVSWIGILLMYIGGHVGLNLMIWWGVITVIVTLLDYMAPIWSTRITGGHKAASTGAILGLIIGLIVPPVGMILGSLLGAFIGRFQGRTRSIPRLSSGNGPEADCLRTDGLLHRQSCHSCLIIQQAGSFFTA